MGGLKPFLRRPLFPGAGILTDAIARCFDHFPNVALAPEDGVVARFTSAAGRWVDLKETLGFNGQVSIGPANSSWYDETFDFPTPRAAFDAFEVMYRTQAPEPLGWIKHSPSGRRRYPIGDPASEVIGD